MDIKYEINEEIKDKEVRVIDEEGVQFGILSIYKALELASKKNLDLVKISSNSIPPVCKIMNYGKYRFEMEKKEKEAKKNQKVVEIKEIQLSMTIDIGDINVKAKQAIKFLESGKKVKVNIKLKGRQINYSEKAIEVMDRFSSMLEFKVDKKPTLNGRNVYMILTPLKK